jgi:hypothetical protein
MFNVVWFFWSVFSRLSFYLYLSRSSSVAELSRTRGEQLIIKWANRNVGMCRVCSCVERIRYSAIHRVY